jgi:hypothetical protein
MNDDLIFLLPPGALWNLHRKLVGKDMQKIKNEVRKDKETHLLRQLEEMEGCSYFGMV